MRNSEKDVCQTRHRCKHNIKIDPLERDTRCRLHFSGSGQSPVITFYEPSVFAKE
jgi:hypothetical protein